MVLGRALLEILLPYLICLILFPQEDKSITHIAYEIFLCNNLLAHNLTMTSLKMA